VFSCSIPKQSNSFIASSWSYYISAGTPHTYHPIEKTVLQERFLIKSRLELLNKDQKRNISLVLVFTLSLLAVVFKALLREQETRHAIEDAEIKGLELQAQKEMLQQVSIQLSCGYEGIPFSGAKVVIS